MAVQLLRYSLIGIRERLFVLLCRTAAWPNERSETDRLRPMMGVASAFALRATADKSLNSSCMLGRKRKARRPTSPAGKYNGLLTAHRSLTWCGLLSCALPGSPTRSNLPQGAKRRWDGHLKCQRSTSGDQSLDKIKCKVGPQILPHDPCVLSQGHRRRHWAERENRKAPSVAGGAQKSQYAVFSARENSLVHPLEVDTRIREVHMAVRLKPRMTILLKCRSKGLRRDTSRPSGSCLCAISQSLRCRPT
jgi:hypothetical protein